MVDVEYCKLMASYNRWMNERMYALCAGMSDEERKADQGAFFRSIHSTLNHIVFGDLAWLSRITGDPTDVPPLGVDLYEDYAELHAARVTLDQRIVDWVSGFSREWLADSLSYVSRIDNQRRTIPNWVLATHMFNHQTHHRGQITTMLSQLGLDIGSTDIPFMPGVAS